jgi:hypothetical protein
MAMRVEWIVVVLAALPAQQAATALLVVIAPVSAAVLQVKLVWQVRGLPQHLNMYKSFQYESGDVGKK